MQQNETKLVKQTKKTIETSKIQLMQQTKNTNGNTKKSLMQHSNTSTVTARRNYYNMEEKDIAIK
jgi:SLT domain-containing protein